MLAVDPGTRKTGVAVVQGRCASDIRVLERLVIRPELLLEEVRRLLELWPTSTVVAGDRTGSRAAVEALAGSGIAVSTADEHMTSLQARARYFADHPPRGLWRLIPISMRTPPEPVDDYAAVILAERYILQALG